MNSKKIIFKIITLLIVILTSVQCSVNKENMLANDVRLFKNTPAWEVAKAIEKGDTDIVRHLIETEKVCPVDFRETRFKQTLLNWSVYANHYSGAKVLLEMGANPNLKQDDSIPAITQAASKNTSDYLRLMIKYGGNVNILSDIDDDLHLRTPLMAASFSSFDNVKLLVDAGADINFTYTKHGIQNALIYAFNGNRIDVIKYLIVDKKAKYNQVWGYTLNGDSLFITNFLRELAFPLNSKEYKLKMEVVEYIKQEGYDYWKTKIPEHYYQNYDSAYLKRY